MVKSNKKIQIITTARRKRSASSSVLKEGTGGIFINSIPIDNIEPTFIRDKIKAVLSYIPNEYVKKVDVFTTVRGGGISSRIDSCIVSITKSFMKYINDPELERLLKEHDRSVLVSDNRKKASKPL